MNPTGLTSTEIVAIIGRVCSQAKEQGGNVIDMLTDIVVTTAKEAYARGLEDGRAAALEDAARHGS